MDASTIDNLTAGFLGSLFTAAFGLAAYWVRTRGRRKRIAGLIAIQLKQILADLERIGEKVDQYNWIYVSETQYAEIAVGLPLYEHLKNNLDAFGSTSDLSGTIEFFHHYQANLATIRARLDRAPKPLEVGATPTDQTRITKGTYDNLVSRLETAIAELTQP